MGGLIGGVAGGGFADRPIREQMLALHSQVLGNRRRLDEIEQQHQQNHLQQMRQYQTLNSNVRRLAMAPARRIGNGNNNNGNGAGNNNDGGNGNGNGNANQPAATLSPTPRCLYVLWQEYTQGIGGRKAARLFTPQERGQVKHRYTRRKVVWDTIDRLVRQGLTANVAIDRIYEVYGRELTVTRLINRMLSDRRNNSIPAVLQ